MMSTKIVAYEKNYDEALMTLSVSDNKLYHDGAAGPQYILSMYLS